MIEIKIPEEIKDKQKIMFGMNFPQLIIVGIAVGIDVFVYMKFNEILANKQLLYICAVPAIIAFALGWLKYGGLTFADLAKLFYRNYFQCNPNRQYKTANKYKNLYKKSVEKKEPANRQEKNKQIKNDKQKARKVKSKKKKSKIKGIL